MFITSILDQTADETEFFIPDEALRQFLIDTLYSSFQPRQSFTIDEVEQALAERQGKHQMRLDTATLLKYLRDLTNSHLLRTVVPNYSFKIQRLEGSSGSIVDVVKTIKDSTFRNQISVNSIGKSELGQKHALQMIRAACDVLSAVGVLRLSQKGDHLAQWDEEQEKRVSIMDFHLAKCEELTKQIKELQRKRRGLEDGIRAAVSGITSEELSKLV